MKKFLFLIACLTCLCLWPSAKASAQTYVYETGQQVIVNHKIYKVAGANIVANYDFADGTYAGWVSTDAGNAVDASAWEISNGGPDGVNYLHNTGAVGGGSGTANNIRCAWDLEAGKTYLASYYTKGSNANVRFWNSDLEGVKTPSNDLALLVGSDSQDWMQNITVFEATEAAHKALLNCAWCGSGFGVTYICIVPVEYVGEEQVEWTTIEPDTYYNLQILDTDLYLSAGWQDNAQQVSTIELGQGGYEQTFKFAPVADKEGVYNLIGEDGKAIWANGGWNCHWNGAPTEANLASAEYQFSVESEVGYITIKTKNKYIGSDGVYNWSKLYTDKTGSAVVKFVPVKVEEEVPPTPAQTIVDVLNNANTFKGTATTYKEVADVKVSSDAVYFLQCAGGNGTIQLRSTNNNSGVVSTTSGGTLKKVTVTYYKATSNGRTLDVYAKNTPYEKPADLYGDAAGTKVASLNYDSSVGFTYTYTFEGEYQYIGLRSASGAMYIDNIEIEWETVGEGKVFAPTFDPVAGMVKAGTEVTLATQTEGAEIYYTTDESEPTAASTKYTAPIAINDYTVIKAVAIANGKASDVVTAEYMLMPVIEDLSPIMDFPDETPFTVNCELTVVYVNGANVYVYDGTNYALIYKNNLGLEAGDVIAAGWDAQLSIYSGLYEIVPQAELVKSTSEPKAASPVLVDAEDAEYTLMPYNMNRYFTLQDVVFEAATPAGKSNFTGKMGEIEVNFRNNFAIASVEAGTYSVIGFLSVYNDAIQFLPTAYVAPEPEDPNMLWKSDVEAEQSTADWRRVFTMTAEEAQEKIAVGDYLLVTVSYVDPEGSWPQVAVLPIEGWPPYVNEGVSKDAACPFVVRFPIAGPTAKQMWANGFGVSGGEVRISKIALEKATEELDPNTVWFGGKQCNWGDGITLSKDIFADCKAGDKVVINYTPGSEATLQVMPGGWDGPNFPIYAGLPFFVRDEANNQMVFTLQADFDALNYEDKTWDVFSLLKSAGLTMHGPCFVNSILYVPAEVVAEPVVCDNIAAMAELTEEQAMNVKLNLTDAKVTYYAENAGTIFVEDATAAMQLYVMNEDYDYAEVAELAQGKAVTGSIVGQYFEGGMFMALDTDVDITSSVDADVTYGAAMTVAQALEPANANKLVTFTASESLTIANEEGMLIITEGDSQLIVSDPFYSLPDDYEFPANVSKVTGVICNYGMAVLAPRSEADVVAAEDVPYATIEPNVYYNLQIQDTDLYMSAGWQDTNRQVNTLSLGEAGYEQAFKFVPVADKEGVYNLIGLDGKAIYASGGWDCFWNDAATEENLAEAAYQFTVDSQKGYINIKTKNGYIGSDGIWGWSKLYSDKNGDKIVNFVPVKANVDPVTEYTVYFDNSASQWETVYAYAWAGETNNTWPGQEMTKGENDVWSVTFTEFLPENIIFNNGNGLQTEDLVFEAGKTYVGEGAAPATELYLRGSINDWGTSMMFATEDNVTYTLTVNVVMPADAEFKIANADWTVSYTYDAAPIEPNVEYTFIDGNGGPANTKVAVEIPAGAKITFNAQTLAFKLEAELDGINAIDAEDGAEYYNLQGVRLNAPAIGQPCIRVANGVATKVIVK